MKRYLLISSVLLVSIPSFGSGAKRDSSFHGTRFFLLAGASWSAVDLARYNNTEPKLGFTGRIYSYVTSNVRLAGEYTYCFPHKDEPTWENIKAQNFELNAHVTAVVNHSTLGFYALGGISLQQWRGRFTGLNDLKGFNTVLKPGEYESYSHLLANFGCGFEKNFKYMGFFGEFKFRLNQSNSNVKVKINDVVYSVGLKANIRVRKLSGLFRSPGDVYHWF